MNADERVDPVEQLLQQVDVQRVGALERVGPHADVVEVGVLVALREWASSRSRMVAASRRLVASRSSIVSERIVRAEMRSSRTSSSSSWSWVRSIALMPFLLDQGYAGTSRRSR